MLWKIYHLETGKILTAGFADEENAKEWLEEREDYAQEDFIVEEMDSDEEQEWLETHPDGEADDDDEVVAEPSFEEDGEYSEGFYESAELDSEYLSGGHEDED